MTSNRPYLIRALYDWIIDNGMTPYLLVNAASDQVVVPEQFVDDGKIILNIDPQAVVDLQLGNEWVLFSARFSGSRFDIQIPITSVIAIYAKENGQGMIFPDEELVQSETDEQQQNTTGEPSAAARAPHLTIVK